jgi:AAA+ ATPase superfamily predicted ATPase
MMPYPFHNYKGAIDDAHYFTGRNKLLRKIAEYPFNVRIILGGRRIGKTSTLHAIQRELLQSNSRAFPVILELHSEMPNSLENFLYILMALVHK